MKLVSTVVGCLFVFIYSSHAEVSGPETLETISLTEAIQKALKANPTYRSAVSNARAAEGLTYQSGLWENPVFFAEAEEYPPEDSFEESRYLLGLSQTVPFPGKKRLDRAAASEQELSRKSMSDSTRTDLIRRVRIAFYQVLAAEKLVDVSEQLLSLAKSSVETAKERLEAGVSTAQELLRAEVQAERVKNSKLSFERNLKVARAELALTMGEPDLKEIGVTGKLSEEIPEGLLVFDREKVFSSHPRVLAAEALLRRSGALKERAQLEPYPDITLSVSGGRREVDDETLIDFGFSIPLPILNSSKGEVLTASENERKAKSDLEQVKQRLKTQLANEIETLKQADQQVGNYRDRLIPQSEKALRMIQAGFREGEYGFNDLIDTQRTVAEAKIEYLRILFVLNKSIAEVRSLTEQKETFFRDESNHG